MRNFEKVVIVYDINLGLGVVPGERSFFHENDQERSHRSEKRTNA